MASLQEVNQKILGSFTGASGSKIINSIGWLVVGVIIIGLAGWGFYWWWDKKQFNKKTTDFEIVGSHYHPTFRDVAKTVKLGKGGFQILYLKKLKSWRVAYGGRVGKDTYYFFIGRDNYPYNGLLSADINAIDKNGGLIPIVTTNPLMRAQYTSLEKQIDALHGDKKTFWDKYGNWVLTISFVVIVGFFAWMIFREMSPLMGQFKELTAQMTALTEQMNKLAVNLKTSNNGGLVPAQ